MKWHKPVALIATTIGCASVDLLLAWIFNVPMATTLFAGFMARTSVGLAFSRLFAEKESNLRFRLHLGAHLWLLPQGFALLTPSLVTVSTAVAGALLGSGLIWWDEIQAWRETKRLSALVERNNEEHRLIPPQSREGEVRVRIAEIQEKIEPDQDELTKLNEELYALEQKKLYRG